MRYSRNYNKSPQTFDPNQVINVKDIDRYAIDNFDANLRIGKRLNLDISVSSSFTYNMIKHSEFKEGRTISTSGTDKYTGFIQNFTYDTRNLFSYTSAGYLLSLDYYKYGIFNKDIDFNRIKMDSRKFIPIKISELKWIPESLFQ